MQLNSAVDSAADPGMWSAVLRNDGRGERTTAPAVCQALADEAQTEQVPPHRLSTQTVRRRHDTAARELNDRNRNRFVQKPSIEHSYIRQGQDLLPNHVSYVHARRSLSTVGGTHSGQSTLPLLSSSHSPSFSPRNGVRSHSRCGTESWTELELVFHLTVTFLIRLQGTNDSLH